MHSTCQALLILLDLIISFNSGEGYKLSDYTLCGFIHAPIISSIFGQNNLVSNFFSSTFNDVTSSLDTKFHIHTKPQTKLYFLRRFNFKFSVSTELNVSKRPSRFIKFPVCWSNEWPVISQRNSLANSLP
jgi:hypothetical protein